MVYDFDYVFKILKILFFIDEYVLILYIFNPFSWKTHLYTLIYQ